MSPGPTLLIKDEGGNAVIVIYSLTIVCDAAPATKIARVEGATFFAPTIGSVRHKPSTPRHANARSLTLNADQGRDERLLQEIVVEGGDVRIHPGSGSTGSGRVMLGGVDVLARIARLEEKLDAVTAELAEATNANGIYIPNADFELFYKSTPSDTPYPELGTTTQGMIMQGLALLLIWLIRRVHCVVLCFFTVYYLHMKVCAR